MTEERPDGMATAMRWELDHLDVPDCGLRRVTLALAEMFDHPDRDGHLAAASAALDVIRPLTRELYEPKPPLQVQLEYIRAQKIAEEYGIIVPDYRPE